MKDDRKRTAEESVDSKPEKKAKEDFYVKPPPVGRPIRVYADGIFDLFHFGHARALKQAKNVFPNTYLLVGVCSDRLTHKLKGRTVLKDVERYEAVSHCKWVDEVVEDAPWVVTAEFIEKHKIDYVVHGEDPVLDADGNDLYQFVKDTGSYKTIKRTEGISTTDLILRIIKDYDMYVKRNLKRGISAEDMNVPFLKRQQMKITSGLETITKKVGAVATNVETATTNIKTAVKEDLALWQKRSKEFMIGFMKGFGAKQDYTIVSPPTSPKSPSSD